MVMYQMFGTSCMGSTFEQRRPCFGRVRAMDMYNCHMGFARLALESLPTLRAYLSLRGALARSAPTLLDHLSAKRINGTFESFAHVLPM